MLVAISQYRNGDLLPFYSQMHLEIYRLRTHFSGREKKNLDSQLISNDFI